MADNFGQTTFVDVFPYNIPYNGSFNIRDINKFLLNRQDVGCFFRIYLLEQICGIGFLLRFILPGFGNCCCYPGNFLN